MPVLLVLSAALLWATIGPVSKFAFQDGIGALETAFWRGAIASLFLWAHALYQGKWRIRGRDVPALAAFGFLGVSTLEGSYLLAVEQGGAALASILLYSAPLWVALFSRLIFAERLSGAKLLALLAAFGGIVGVALAGSPEGMRFTPGTTPWRALPASWLFWGLLSGLSYASFYIFGKHYLGRYEPITLLAWVFPPGCLGLLPFASFTPKNAHAWTALFVLGFASTYLAYLVYYLGLRKLEPTRAAVIASIEPVAATFLAWWIWAEKLSAWGYFWASWVVGGILFMIFSR